MPYPALPCNSCDFLASARPVFVFFCLVLLTLPDDQLPSNHGGCSPGRLPDGRGLRSSRPSGEERVHFASTFATSILIVGTTFIPVGWLQRFASTQEPRESSLGRGPPECVRSYTSPFGTRQEEIDHKSGDYRSAKWGVTRGTVPDMMG